MKTLLKYAGNKQNIMNQIRPFLGDWVGVTRYVEPFAGALGSAINANVPQCVEIVLSDANSELIDFYSAVAEDASKVQQIANSFPSNEEGYYQIRAWDRKENWKLSHTLNERAARTIYLNRRCFNGLYRINKNTGYFNTPWNRKIDPLPITITENSDFINLLNRSKITHCNWQKTVTQCGVGDVVYCDPPYVDIKNPIADFGGYIGNFGLVEQVSLRNELVNANNRGAHVLVSNSWCDATLDIYSSWNIEKVFATRKIGSRMDSRGKTPELLAWLPPKRFLSI